MSSAEHYPAASADSDPGLKVIQGDGPLVWSRTPEGFGVTAPITSDLFRTSNLISKLQSHSHVQRTTARGRVTEVPIPRTRRGTIVGEIYRKCLPRDAKELVDTLQNQALEEELIYEADGIASDGACQAQLDYVAQLHSDSLLMKGFQAFADSAYDFNDGLHEDLIKDARRFGAYLIEIT